MISPHAQALYDRLLKKGKGIGETSPESNKESNKHTDLAPEKEDDKNSNELALDEMTSDQPDSLHGLDQGQHSMHPGDQGADEMSHVGKPKIPDIGQILMDSHGGASPRSMGGKINAKVKSFMKK